MLRLGGVAGGDRSGSDVDGNMGGVVQSGDGAVDPTGAVTYNDKEVVYFNNADGITVHDGDTEIGTFEDVLLGTANDDSYGVDGYANGGAGDDELFGGGSRDWLVGGTGDDDLYGGGAGAHLEGGRTDERRVGKGRVRTVRDCGAAVH